MNLVVWSIVDWAPVCSTKIGNGKTGIGLQYVHTFMFIFFHYLLELKMTACFKPGIS